MDYNRVMSASWQCELFLFSSPLRFTTNWKSTNRFFKKEEKRLCTAYQRDPSICAPESGRTEPWRRLWSKGSDSSAGVAEEVKAEQARVGPGVSQHSPLGEEGADGGKELGGVCLATCTAAWGTNCCLWRGIAVTGGKGKEKEVADQKELKESLSCCLPKEATGPPADLYRVPLLGHRHTQSPKDYVTSAMHPPTLCHHLFFLMPTLPSLSGKSALAKRTENLCYSATFWRTKGRRLTTNQLNY